MGEWYEGSQIAVGPYSPHPKANVSVESGASYESIDCRLKWEISHLVGIFALLITDSVSVYASVISGGQQFSGRAGRKLRSDRLKSRKDLSHRPSKIFASTL
jgi:hypothetical protein